MLVLLCLSLDARAAPPVAPRPPTVPAPAATRARGGVRLLEAMTAGGPVLVGRVDAIERLDPHGYTAWIHVERALGEPDGATEPGSAVRIAWEELAASRPPRFDDSERVLVCLERLGSASIWRQRIPDPSERRQTAGIAMQGDAFLRDPRLGTVDVLHHYLSLSPADRETAAGAGYLASLAAGAQVPLAEDAARRLAGMEDPGGKLAGFGDALIVRALLRDDADGGLEAALLEVVAASATPSLAKELKTATRGESLPAPRLFRALALASSGLPASDVARLLASREAVYRVVVAQTAEGDRAVAILTKLMASDPSPEVRAAAVVRLSRLEGKRSLPRVLAALCDDDSGVRTAAAAAAASQGDAAIPGLRAVAYGQDAACKSSAAAPRAAVDGLSRLGPAGRKTLAEIAEGHSDPAVRKLAGIALGELDPHVH